MIRFSAVLVAVAIGVLIAGGVTSGLALVYLAIVVSALAMVFLVIGVLLNRREFFGNRPGLVPAGVGASPAVPVSEAGQDQSAAAAPALPAPAAAAAAAVPLRVLTPAVSTDLLAASPAAGPRYPADLAAAAPWERPTRAEPRPFTAAGQTFPVSARTAPEADAALKADAAPEADAASADSAAAEPGSTPPSSGWFNGPGPAGISTTTAASDEPAAVGEPPILDEQPIPSLPAVPPDEPAASLAAAGTSGTADSKIAAAETPAVETPAVETPAVETPAVETAAAEIAAVRLEAAEGLTAETKTVGAPPEPADDAAAAPIDTASANLDPSPGRDELKAVPASETPADKPVPADDESDELVPADGDLTADASAETSPENASGEAGELSQETGAAIPEADSTAPAAEAGQVAVIRGVPRFHDVECVLICFMPQDDLAKMSIPEAREAGCTPCTACQPPDNSNATADLA